MSDALVAPALSTAQDEADAFAKVEGMSEAALREKRIHLGPEYTSNKYISYEKTRQIISEYYSLDRLASFLNGRDFETGNLKYPLISLQFPDDLVCDSTLVSQILQDKLNKWNKEKHDLHHDGSSSDSREQEIDFTTAAKAHSMDRDIESVEKTIDPGSCGGKCGSNCKNKNKFQQEVWILADTSYSPCCIDEVAAEHVNADIVVHFGDACLNPVDKIKSAYVFGKPFIDVNALIENFRSLYSDKDHKIVIMADTAFSHVLSKMYDILHSEYSNIIVADIDYAKAGANATIIDAGKPISCEHKGTVHTANRILRGFKQEDIDEYLETIDEDDENYVESTKFDGLTQDYSLFHITRPHDARILMLCTKFNEVKIIDPKDVSLVYDQFPTMMKRYRNMQVTRSASTVGILVNTLSLANTRTLLNKIVKSVTEAGKKHYMFVVGKPNVAKLANFECVDVWCIIGCGQSGIVIDMYGDYYKPIITPYELQLALLPQITWTGKWVTDFDDMLDEEDKAECKNTPLLNDENVEEKDEGAPEFDPVTGTLKLNQPLRQLRHLQLELESEKDAKDGAAAEETGLVKRFSGALTVGSTISTSALGLQSREWTGLGSDFGTEESSKGALVEDGRTGVARGYENV